MFLSDRIAFIDTLMPLDYFHLVEYLWRRKKIFQSSHKDALNTAAFLAHTANSLIPPDRSYHV